MVVLGFFLASALAVAAPLEADSALHGCLPQSASRLAQRIKDPYRRLLYQLAWWERAPGLALAPRELEGPRVEWRLDAEVWQDEYEAAARVFRCRAWEEPLDAQAWLRWPDRRKVLAELLTYPEGQHLERRLRSRELLVEEGDAIARESDWRQAFLIYRKAASGLTELPPGLAFRLAWSGTDLSIPFDDLAVRSALIAVNGNPTDLRRLEQRVCSRMAGLSPEGCLKLWNDLELHGGKSPHDLWNRLQEPCSVQGRWEGIFALMSQEHTREFAQALLADLRVGLLEGLIQDDFSWMEHSRFKLRRILAKDARLRRSLDRTVALLRRRLSSDSLSAALSAPHRVPVLELAPSPDFGPVPPLPPLEKISFVREWEKSR